MEERTRHAAFPHTPTRRQVATGIPLALCCLASAPSAIAHERQEKAGSALNRKRTSLHEDIDLKSDPPRIYAVLLDARQFAAFTGAPAEIDPKPGGAFSLFGGQIVGRNVELVSDQRIVQAWRPSHWSPGVYSIVEFEFKLHTSGTTVALDHKGFPEGDFDHLESGWHAHYWEPLKKFLAKG
jgi:activator of HSP90 ATPase